MDLGKIKELVSSLEGLKASKFVIKPDTRYSTTYYNIEFESRISSLGEKQSQVVCQTLNKIISGTLEKVEADLRKQLALLSEVA